MIRPSTLSRDQLRRLVPRHVVDAVLVLLSIAAIVAVVYTVRWTPPTPDAVVVVGSSTPASARPTTSPSQSPSPSPSLSPPPGPPRAAVAASGDVVLRWSGTACPGPGPSVIERSDDAGRTWTAVSTPLAAVERLSLSGLTGLAVGSDAECRSLALVTTDGGTTWRTFQLPSGTVSTDAVGGGGMWSIVGAEVGRGAVGRTPALVSNGCAAEADAGPASIVAADGPGTAWLVCQRPDGGDRLLLGTDDGGEQWRRLAGVREESGLAGPGRIAALDFTTADAGWALIHGAGCAAGELRTTADGGATWHTTRCVRSSVPGVTTLLAVVFAGPDNAFAFGLVNGVAVPLTSADGGDTWAAVS